MSDSDLLALLRREEADSSSYFGSEIAASQADAMDAYHGKIRDDVQLPNRSHAVTHDIEDTVNWLMPPLLRTFAPSDDFLSVDDHNLEDGASVLKDAQNYLSHVFFRDNRGETVIHDFCFDGLLQKLGTARVCWQDPEPKPPMYIEGATLDQLIKFESDPEYEILEVEEDGTTPPDDDAQEGFDDNDADANAGQAYGQMAQPQPGQPQPGMMGDTAEPAPPAQPQQIQPQQIEPTFSVKIQRTPRHGRAIVEAIPPEEFRVSRRARSIDAADYHSWQYHDHVTTLLRLHPDHAYELDPDGNHNSSSSGDVTDSDSRVYARFPNEPSTGIEPTGKVVVLIEYVRADVDGDGIVELRRIKRVGNTILENDAVEESEFVVWTPIRVAHRMIGRSISDTLLDIQKIRTELMRAALDSLALSTKPRTILSKQATAADPSLLDKFLDHEIGDVLEVSGDPNQVVMQLTSPDVSSVCFTAMEQMDRRSEEASGVNRHSMGIQPAAITDTKGGIEMLQAAGNARVEQTARWLAFGLEEIFGKLLRTLIRHQDHARTVKINGRKLKVDPRRWSDDMVVSVHVGAAAENRSNKIAMLTNVLAMQKDAIVSLGMGNPMVGLHHVRNTVGRIVSTMGFKNANEFFGEVDPNWKPPEQGQQQDPKLIEIQGKQQMAQADLQARAQRDQAEMQHKREMAQVDAQHRQQELMQKGQIELQIAAKTLENEHELAKMRIQAEQETSRMRMAQERELALEKMANETQLAREMASIRQSMPETHVSGFRPGGALNA